MNDTFAAQAIGRILIIAVDYDRYFISKRCRDETHERKYVPLECYKRIKDRNILGTSQIS